MNSGGICFLQEFYILLEMIILTVVCITVILGYGIEEGNAIWYIYFVSILEGIGNMNSVGIGSSNSFAIMFVTIVGWPQCLDWEWYRILF